MSLPKLGLVSIGVHDDVLNWVAKYKPVSILVVNERGQSNPERPWENNEIDAIRKAMNASPKTLWIFRSWPDGIGEGRELGGRVRICFKPFLDMPNPKMGHSFNEPGFPWIGATVDAALLAHEERKFAWLMHTDNLLSMNFCFSESHILKGNMGLWEIYAEALPYVDALGFNEYDWPSVFTSRDQGYKWRIGHWEHQVARLREILPDDYAIPPVIIGEGILDGKIEYPHPFGWQKLMAGRRYVDDHRAVHADTYHKPEVFSHHTFCYCHPSSEWRSYSVKPILTVLGNLVKSAPKIFWEDYHKEPEMGVWKNVPQSIAQWRSLIEKVTSSFHVPIPDYNGIHVSPAKVVTCIIKIESNGDPKAVGGAGHAHGLMQVWKDHHPGKNLFDPEVNIRTGLEILKNKLDKAQGDLESALYFYSGGGYWATRDNYTQDYWQPFVEYYKQFWGIDLEPKSNDRIQESLEGLARIDSKLDGIDYLVKQIREERGSIEDDLLNV